MPCTQIIHAEQKLQEETLTRSYLIVWKSTAVVQQRLPIS